MPENKNRDANWDTNFVMSNAKSLRCVVTELDRNGSKSPQADQLLFSGVILAESNLIDVCNRACTESMAVSRTEEST